MNKIGKFFKHFTVGQMTGFLLGICCLLVWTGLTCFVAIKKSGLSDQKAAERWSSENDSAQLSCFFTVDQKIDESRIKEFQYHLDTILKEASLTAENELARPWLDAYSAQGSVLLEGARQSLEAQAIGIGGDFFFFHPLQLLTGSYFSGSDLMQDKILLDEDAAWQLFGSNDIAGMQVMISGIPHYVAGVIRREDSYFHKEAGLRETTVYVSYDTLSKLGTTQGINTYEIIMPNPVRDFAAGKVREKFGIDEKQMQVVENSDRYSLESLLTVLADFGIRSMNFYGILYPYWENVARGWEDVFAWIGILQVVTLLIPLILCGMGIIAAWRKRQWNREDVQHMLSAVWERASEVLQKQKSKWKHVWKGRE